jgi:hypothetical protein
MRFTRWDNTSAVHGPSPTVHPPRREGVHRRGREVLDLELGPYLYDDDNEGREIKAVSSGVGAHTGWVAIEYRDDGPSRWVREKAVVSLRTL